MNKKEFYSELRIRCTEETSNLDRTWSSWFLYQQTLLMSLIPKSKANSSAAEYRTVSTLKLSWRKEDTHTKLWGELRATSAPQTHPWSCCQTLPSSLHIFCSKGSSHKLCQAQVTRKRQISGCTSHVPSQRLFSPLLHYQQLKLLFCFLVLHLLFLFHLIAKDCIETLQNHRALCHITKQTTFTENSSFHLPLLCLCSILLNFFLHHKAAATLMEVSLIPDIAISYTDNGKVHREVSTFHFLCVRCRPLPAQMKQGT